MKTETPEIRWFKAVSRNRVDGEMVEEVYAIYRAEFKAKILLKEERWRLPVNGFPHTPCTDWEPTRAVSEWFFVGKDDVWETSESEALDYLPPQARNYV